MDFKKVGDLAKEAKGELKETVNRSVQPDPDYTEDKISPDMRPMAAFLAAVVRSGVSGRRKKILLALPVIPMLMSAWKNHEAKTPRDKILAFLPLIPILVPALSSPLAIFVFAALHAQGVDKKIADSIEELYGRLDKTTLRKISEKIESISLEDLRALLQSLPTDGLKGMSQDERIEVVKKMGAVLKQRLRTGEPPAYLEKKDDSPPPPSPEP